MYGNDTQERLEDKREAQRDRKEDRREEQRDRQDERNDRPDGIAWLLRNHPELPDVQIGKLLGTTKETIQKVRDRTHWNSANIKPRDPVILGLCTQGALNAAVTAAQERLRAEGIAIPLPVPADPE